MNKFIVKLKSQVIQINKTPGDRRLFNNYWNTINEIKSVREEEFEEVFYEITHSQFFDFPYISAECIRGNFFPKRFEAMCAKKELPFTNNFQKEIRWWTACFQLCPEEINYFIESRKNYDTCILLGNYEKALEVLDSVEQYLGVSLWLYESKIFVYNKLEKNVDEIIEQMQSGFNSFIIRFYAIKNLHTITYTEYKKIALNALKDYDDEDFVTYMKYQLLPMEYRLDAIDFIPLMLFMHNGALIDKYLVFLDIFETVIARGGMDKYKSILGAYVYTLKDIQDERLQAMRFCIDTQQKQLEYPLKSKLLLAKEDLLVGKVRECRDAAVEVLNENPYCIQAINIVAETDIKLQDKSECFEGTLLKELIDDLESVYSMQEGWKQSISALNKSLNCCSMSNWSRSLAASVMKSYNPVDDENYIEAQKIESLQYLDIETVCDCLPTSEALVYLSQMASLNKYYKFRKALLEDEYDEAYKLVENRDIICIIRVCDNRKNLEEKKKYLNLIKNNEDTFFMRAAKYYLSKLDLDIHFNEALHYAVDLLIDNINRALYIPWELYINKIEESDIQIRSDICVPILYYVQYRYRPSETKDDVVLMCEDFLYLQGKDLPSLLNVHDNTYPSNKMIFFLRYVCVPDILSTALASKITNSMDLWKERIDICQILCNLDDVNEKVYEEEIRALTQKRKIYSELKIIEENRIHVNVEGMRQRLLDELEGEFARFKLYSDKRLQTIIEAMNQKKGEQIVFWTKEPERVLQELIIKIRDAFVSSAEYGLDFTLSLSIRHGAIGDALRRPLANAGLISIFNDKTEEYEWHSKLLDGMQEEDQETVKKAVIQLNIDTEQIITDLKTKYIQVKTEQSHEEGIFDYSVTQYEFEQLLLDATYTSDLPEFIEHVFEYLWKKTENNLLLMKKLLKDNILTRYQRVFKTLKDTIDTLEHKEKGKGLRRKIVDASNEMQNAIDNICFWFQRSTESKNQDFDLDFVFQMGYETICNMHPETRFVKIELEKSRMGGEKIEGKHLKAYSDIFYNLFDNIYKKATDENGVKKIEYSLAQENDRQYIYLQNDYDCTGDISNDCHKLEELDRLLDSEEYLEHVRGEGGTGIPKICKIIRKDLGRQGIIKFGFKEKQNKFFIEIEI